MKPRLILCLMLIAAGSATAAVKQADDRPPLVPEQFAWQWPLDIPAATRMAQLTLTPSVYRQLQRDDLRDLAAFNASGESMPLGPIRQRRDIQRPALSRSQPLPLPIFPLQAASADAAEGFRLSVQRDANGQLRRLEAETTPVESARASGWIIDASQLDQMLVGFRVALPDGIDQDLNVSVLVEGSNDLQRWVSAAPPRALVSLNRDGLSLRRLTLDVPPARFNFWRLRPVGEQWLPMAAIDALIAPAGALPEPLSRIELEQPSTTEKAGEFTYRLAGPLPVELIDVRLANVNALANVMIESRAGADRPWTERARAVAFLLPGDIGMQPLAMGPTRDREWRLRSEPPLPRAPQLTAFYRDETFVVLAQGDPPYRLAAGSVSARRPDYPLDAPLAALASRQGSAYSLTAIDRLGEGSPLAGDAALILPPAPMAWRKWALWTVLLVGVVAIVGMSATLLRSRHTDEPAR